MKLKGYIKLFIMALAIMFLAIDNVSSSTSTYISQTSGINSTYVMLQATNNHNGQVITLTSLDNSNIKSIDYIRFKIKRNAGDETGNLLMNVSVLNSSGLPGTQISSDSIDITQFTTDFTWTTLRSSSLSLDNVTGTQYAISFICNCDHVYSVSILQNLPSITTDGYRFYQNPNSISEDHADMAYEIGYSFGSNEETFIEFDKTQYALFSIGTINYSVDTSFWNNYVYKYYRVFINNEYPDETKEQYYIYSSQGQDQVQFTKLGRYDTYIKQTGLLGTPNDDDDIIAQASAIVLQNSDSLITDKDTYNISENIRVSGYLYPDETSNNIGYIWLQADGSSNYEQYSFSVNQPYSFSKTYNLPAGRYNFTLMKYKNYGICQGTNYILSCFYSSGYSKRVIVSPGLKSNGYGNISIKWKNSQGLINSLQTLNFTNATWRDTIYIYDNFDTIFGTYDTDKYNYQMDILIPNNNNYIGTWKAKIVNSSNTNEFNWSNISIVSKSMMNYTNDFGVTIDFDQDEGNGGIHGVKWYTGTYRGNYSIQIMELKNGLIIKEDYFNSTSTQTQTGNYYLDTNYEYYQARFIDNNSLVLSSSNIKIIDWVQRKADETTAGEEYGLGDDKTSTGMLTNFLILLGMPIFWGLVFLIAGIYYLRKNSALILPVLFILINVEAVVGLLEPYTMYIVVVTWLVIAINFIFVQRKTTG